MERLPSNSNAHLPTPTESHLRKLAVLPQVKKALSIADKTILNAYVQRKIKDYEGKDAAYKLADVIKFAAYDIGYNPKDKSEWEYNRIRIVQIICKYYSELTIEDVKAAFEMLSIGELDRYIPSNERKHYGQFSAEYAGKILNAYKSRQDAAISVVYDNAPSQEQKPSEEETKQGIEYLDKIYNIWFDYYRTSKKLPSSNEQYVSYHYIVAERLERMGMFTRQEPLQEHRKKAYAEYMRLYSIGRKNENEAAYIRKTGEDAQELDYLAQKYSDLDGIKEAFDKIINGSI